MDFQFDIIDREHTRRDSLFVVVVLLFCAVLWFMPTGFESDSGNIYSKAVVLSVDNADIIDFGLAKQGTQNLELKLLGAGFEGELVSGCNILVGDIQLDYTFVPDEIVRVEFAKNEQGGVEWVDVIGPDRLRVELVLVVIFIVLLIVVGGITGFKAIVSFGFTVLLIWKVLIPLSLKQYDPILIGLVVVGILTFVINLLIGGLSKKGLIAFLGGMSGILLACILAVIFSPEFSLTGAVKPFAKSLLIKTSGNVDITRVFIAGIFIACSGAVMDLAMDISAALTEIKKHNPNVRFWPLMVSGMQIGRAVIGTMTTTLLLAYSGGYTTMLMYFMAQGLHPTTILNSTFISAEVLNTLVGSFGLVTVAPFTALIASAILCDKVKHIEA